MFSTRMTSLSLALTLAATATAHRADAQDTPRAPDAAAASNATNAATATDVEPVGGEYRVVNGHRFITPMEGYSAFTNTSFGFAQGFGVMSFELPSPLTGELTPGSLFLYGQQFFGQIGIANRVSIDLVANGVAAVGGNLDTILGIGALAQLTAGGMPKVRILTLENIGLQVSAGVGVFYERAMQISPSALVGKDAGEVPGAEAKLVQQTEAMNVVPALMIAEGSGPFGAQISVAPKIGVAGDGKTSGLDAAAQVTFDIRGVTKAVPVALNVAYAVGTNFDTTDTAHTIGGGLYYTGRRDFELGVTAGVKPGDLTSIQGLMVMQYYF